MSDRIYYRVAASSPVMQIIREAEEQQRKFYAACDALQREFPKTKLWSFNIGRIHPGSRPTRYSRIAGLEFPGDLPDGWRKVPGRSYAVPNRKTAKGRQLALRIRDMKGVDAFEFSTMMSSNFRANYTFMADHAVMFTVYEKQGKHTILNVPAGVKQVPPGCVELKMSEVWRIRERAEERAREEGEAGKKPS